MDRTDRSTAHRRPGRGLPRTLGLGVGAIALVAAACGGPTNLTTTTVVGNLAYPWDIAFTPDGRMLFTERPGPISVLVNGAKRELHRPADVFATNEAGMMGLAVDPAFSATSNRYIYACFVSTITGGRDVRVARWTVDANYTALSNRTDIVTGGPVSSGRHSGCRIRFGPDGNLWITMGDAAIPTVPQNPGSLGGKILRVTRTGAAPAGNAGAPFLPQIYSYGHRNPQGVSFRPSDGKAFAIEHGTDRDDEINVLQAGGNYGWDPVSPTNPSLYDESQPMTNLTKFPNAIPAVWSSGAPTIAPSGGTFLTGSQWAGWSNQLAVAVLKDTELRVFSFDTNGVLVGNVQAIDSTARLRVAVQGPDGNLYLATDANPGQIQRVTPS